MWNGERILPEGYVNFVSTLAPAWAADKRPIYGGFFWLNGTSNFPVPTSAYSMLGVGGQLVLIVPSHDRVVVRMGFDKGERLAGASVQRALTCSWRGCRARGDRSRVSRRRTGVPGYPAAGKQKIAILLHMSVSATKHSAVGRKQRLVLWVPSAGDCMETLKMHAVQPHSVAH